MRSCVNRLKLFCGQTAVGAAGIAVGEFADNKLASVAGVLTCAGGLIGIVKETIVFSRLTSEHTEATGTAPTE